MNKKPNVLFMTVDDLRPLLNCYGQKEMHTPHFDRLAESGVIFEKNFSQVPICMASRASFMTGQRPDRHQIYSCRSVQDLMPNVPTINKHFESAGYRMKGMGKVYHFMEDNEAQFGDAYQQPDHKAFGRGYVTEESRKGIERNSREREAAGLGPEHPTNGRGPCTEKGLEDASLYPDGSIANHAVRALNEFADSPEEAPFFLALGWRKPHLPFVAPESFWDLYPDEKVPHPENDQMPEGMPEFSSRYNYGELRNYVDVPYSGSLPDPLVKRLQKGYRACVSFVDAQVGKVLDALDETGLTESTVVVLVVDHGFSLGDHSLFCKHTAFKESTHVPMMIRAPGVSKEQGRIQGLSENIDLFPTLCDLCGVAPPHPLDGNSRVDWLRNPENGGKSDAYTLWAAEHKHDPEKAVLGYTIRTDEYRYTEWTHLASQRVEARELFHLKEDPLETVNLAEKDGWKEIQKNLSEELQRIKSDSPG